MTDIAMEAMAQFEIDGLPINSTVIFQFANWECHSQMVKLKRIETNCGVPGLKISDP